MERWRLSLFKLLHGRGISRLPGGKALVRRARERFRGSHSIVHGFPMDLDPDDTLRLSLSGVYEPMETRLAAAAVRPGDHVIDLGAFIGYYTLLFSKLVGPTGRVFAFEPTPESFAILQGNVRRNSLDNVELVNAACGSESRATATLFLNRANRGDNHVFDVDGDGYDTVPVRIVRVDDQIPVGRAVNFVKMDIQGAEPAALRGMVRTIGNSPGMRILTEFWPLAIQRAGFDPGNFLDELAAMGFTFRHVDRIRRQLVPRSKEELLSTDWIIEKGTYLYCSRPGDALAAGALGA